MRHRGFVLAYHGCDQKIGEDILAGKEEVQPSTNDHDWLGKGAYFWEDSPARAKHWAEFLKNHPASSAGRITTPFVIGAIIAPDNCLDLCEAASLDLLKEAHAVFKDFMSFSRSPLPENEPAHKGDADLVKRKLDCAVINFLHLLRDTENKEPFATIRGPFFEGPPLYPGAKIANRTHIQWCVRNPARNILGYFRVRSETAA